MTGRRLFAATAACALASLTAASSGPASGGRVGTTLGNASFPQRALVVTLPRSAPLTAGGVQVYENGRRVDRVAVSGRDTHAIGVVLALDESVSMRGAPLSAARRAAQAFADRRLTSQGLGVVTFNAALRTVLEPTTNAHAIEQALARPPQVASGTRIWDAVDRSIELLRATGVRAGSVVVLSDGRDTRSRVTPQQVAADARAAAVRIFTVGLRSPQFDPEPLRQISLATGGAYAETSSGGLVQVYAALAERFAREYVVAYSSVAHRGSTVHVTVVVPAFGRAAGTATVQYTVPLPPGAILERSSWDRFVASRGSVAAMVLIAAALAAAAVGLGLRALRDRPVRRRIAPFVGVDVGAARGRNERVPLSRRLERFGFWQGFERDLDIGRVTQSAELLTVAALAASAVSVVAVLLAGLPWLSIVAILPPAAVRWHASREAARMRARFEEQLPDTLQVLASALRAGHGLAGALRVAGAEAPEPTRGELDRALAEEQLGVPLDDALTVVAGRMRSVDLEHVAFVAGVHRQTGGNTAEVLDRVHDAVRERFELRRTVRTLTAQARLTRWILVLLPVLLAGAISLLNREYMQPLYGTTFGRGAVALAVAMVVAGFLLIKRLTEIKV